MQEKERMPNQYYCQGGCGGGMNYEAQLVETLMQINQQLLTISKLLIPHDEEKEINRVQNQRGP